MADNQPYQLIALDEIPPQYALKSQNRAKQGVELLKGLKLAKGGKLKKEYVRAGIIRQHKKYLRMLLLPKKNNKALRKTVAKVALAEQSAYNQFKEWSTDCGRQLKDICLTESGPETDGKSKRKGENKGNSKSFNDAFIKKYLESSEMQESFNLFIEYIFASGDPDLLNKHLSYVCCLGPHSDNCMVVWQDLKAFFLIEMLGKQKKDEVIVKNDCVDEEWSDIDSLLDFRY